MLHMILSSLIAATLGAAEPAGPVRVLLVTGVDVSAHNWKTSTPALALRSKRTGSATCAWSKIPTCSPPISSSTTT